MERKSRRDKIAGLRLTYVLLWRVTVHSIAPAKERGLVYASVIYLQSSSDTNRPGDVMSKDVSAPKVGEEAPDFTLRSHLDTDVKLSDFRGKKNVVLAFYPLAFTPV